MSYSRRGECPRLSTSASFRLARSGNSRSSRNRSTNSSRLSTKRNASSPSPSPAPPALAAALARPRKHIAFDELLVAGQHHVARAAFAAEARLVHAVDRDADLAAFQDILDVPVLRRLLHRPLNQRLCTTQKALAVLQTLAARIQAPVDDVNGHVCIRLSRPASRACTTRPAGEPAARCSRARPCARRTRRASSRSRRPSSSRTRSRAADPPPARISAFRSLREFSHSWSRTGSCRHSGPASAART